jgi:rubrerythrin
MFYAQDDKAQSGRGVRRGEPGVHEVLDMGRQGGEGRQAVRGEAVPVHAANHWRALGNIGETDANLEHAIEGENYEVDEMYPAFEAVAEHQGEKNALRSIRFAFEVEKVHAKLYAKAKEAVDSGMDAELGDLHVCPVCGYTVEGNPPDNCPVCGAKKELFSKF